MEQPWTILKFGGTSVAGATQWRAIAERVRRVREAGRRVVLVCSALAGMTDRLMALAARPGSASNGLSGVREAHRCLAESLDLDVSPWLEDGMAQLEQQLSAAGDAARTAGVVAMGEWFSSRLGAAFLGKGPHPAVWVDAREALAVVPEPDPGSPRAWLYARCEAHRDEALATRWGALSPVLITQGYVARAPDGRIALLGRGGSDTSAALLGARLGADHVQIWTDVPGLFTADPRREPNARLIEALGWEEALEMAASGARVIHGRSIRAAAAAGIPLWIRDLSNPDTPGTRIVTDPGGAGADARAVVCQENMLVLLLENLDTRQQVGFLSGVFAVISERGLSVDQVATSETTTTLAIDTAANHLDDAGVDALTRALESLCRVRTFRDCSCVSVVGRHARLTLHGLAGAQAFFDEHPLLMMSHSAADRSISLLVRSAGADALARLLHARLVVGEVAHG